MVRHTGVVAEAVSGSAVDGDAVHGQGLGPIDREGLNRRVLDGESVAKIWLAAIFFFPKKCVAKCSYMDEVVKL